MFFFVCLFWTLSFTYSLLVSLWIAPCKKQDFQTLLQMLKFSNLLDSKNNLHCAAAVNTDALRCILRSVYTLRMNWIDSQWVTTVLSSPPCLSVFHFQFSLFVLAVWNYPWPIFCFRILPKVSRSELFHCSFFSFTLCLILNSPACKKWRFYLSPLSFCCICIYILFITLTRADLMAQVTLYFQI